MKLHFLLRKYFLLLVIVIAFVPCSIDSWVNICTLPKNVFTFSKLNFSFVLRDYCCVRLLGIKQTN